MSRVVSPSANRVYGLALVCAVWGLCRSALYARRARERRAADAAAAMSRGSKVPGRRKRGPIGSCTDAELASKIRALLTSTQWVGEGHRKLWARLRMDGTRSARRRVLRVMREEGLLATRRPERVRGPQAHDRSITPPRPNQLWGTDATSTLTLQGNATIFFVIDHCTAECLGIHAALRATRFEAIEALRQAVREATGRFDRGVAPEGLGLRHDHGSQFVSTRFQDELRFLGIRSTPSFVGEPQGNGCAERFVRTLKEQLLWLRRFDTLEDLNAALQAFRTAYNDAWLVERHGYLSPRAQRAKLLGTHAV